MAYIAPNSIVYILKGVPIDSSYNHTGYFASVTAQLARMVSYRKHTLTTQSYQRVYKDKIRVSVTADDLYDCNYMMFQNTAYGGKWFYAFINEVEYINNNCSEITYSIDVMQTWMFDYQLGACFVEREHSATDEIGDNTVPENFEIGEKVDANISERWFNRFFGCIISTKDLWGTSLVSDRSIIYHLEAQGNLKQSIGGIPNSCYMYLGIPLSEDDIDYWEDHEDEYYMQDWRAYNLGSGNVNPTLTASNPGTVQGILNAIANNDPDRSLDDIVGIYMYPADLSRFLYTGTAQSLGYKWGSAAEDDALVGTRPVAFYSPKGASISYTPKNKKLFTYPYIDLKLTNNQGDERIYEFERFQASHGISFRWCATQNNATILMYPTRYNLNAQPFNSGVSLYVQIPLPTKSNAFDSWLQSQKYSTGFNLLGGAISSAIGIAGGIATGNTLGAVASGASLVTNIGSTIGNLMDIKNQPDQVNGNITNGSLNVATYRVGFQAISRTIKAEYAEIIDNYFTMFGYATHRVKVPNIADSTAPKRQYWNYIKTQGCVIHASSGNGLPAGDESKIAKIYDNGITFWNDLDDVGDYSKTNSIVTP